MYCSLEETALSENNLTIKLGVFFLVCYKESNK